MRSIEQLKSINIARRLLRLWAPEYRIVALEGLERAVSALDRIKKTIEVSELSSEAEALAAVLFWVGSLKYPQPEYNLDMSSYCLEHAEADRQAANWSMRMLILLFGFEPEAAEELISPLIWGERDYLEHFSSVQLLDGN